MRINLLDETAHIPTRGSALSAGYDLYADIPDKIVIPPETTIKIPTGIAIELPHDCFGAIYPRSGISTKYGLRLANCVGVIDEDYRGQVVVPIYNDSVEYQVIEPDERIAQLIVQPYVSVELEPSNVLTKTDRGAGGFGSTGLH